MRWNKMKAVLAGAILAVSVAVTGVNVQAATVDEGKTMEYVGDYINVYNVSGLKINNKATSKSKKKIKTVKTAQNSQYSTYRTKAYFRNSSSLYASSNDQEKEHGSLAFKYYPATASYQLTFLKAGTYKISYVDYELESYDYDYDHYDAAKGKSVYNITKLDRSTGEWKQITTATYESSGTQAVESFYQGANGTKYAEAKYSDGHDSGFVPVTLAKAADGKMHVKYQARKLEKVTHTKTYKVLATSRKVKSVKLGKSTNTNSITYKEGSSSSSVKKAKLLSGNSGKVTVTMGDKNYKLTSILVRTYDENSKPVYTKVGNKQNVTYGKNIITYYESSPEATYKYYSKTMYKPTDVLVFYQDKFYGNSTTINSMSKDAQGNNTYVITKTYPSENPDTGKEVILTSTYNITEKKPYEGATYTRFYYTETYMSYNYTTKRYEKKTYESYEYDLEDFFSDCVECNFYKK